MIQGCPGVKKYKYLEWLSLTAIPNPKCWEQLFEKANPNQNSEETGVANGCQ